jgi:cation:H+ antiporter
VVLRLGGIHLSPVPSMLVFGPAIVASAFLLVWAAEAARHDISGSLATAILAVIAVLPEYAVDLYFAWSAGHVPQHAHYAAANMTGSNRLLLGLGWPFVAVLFAWGAWRRGEPARGIELHSGRRTELVFLGAASLYALIIPVTRRLALYDSAVLLALFGFYLWRAAQGERSEPDLVGVARHIGELPRFAHWEAIALFVLFALQFPFPQPAVRLGLAAGYTAIALVLLVRRRAEIPKIVRAALAR